MHGLVLEWEKCPDGVELIDYGPPKALAPGKTLLSPTEPEGFRFRYRSGRRTTLYFDISNLEDPLVVRFVNACVDADRLQFFSRFGLLYRGPPNDLEMPHEVAVGRRDSLFGLLKSAGGSDPTVAVKAINKALTQLKTSKLTAGLVVAGVGQAARLTLQPESLFGFMLMETAMVAANGARLAHCEHCSSAFLTGPLTGRRSHARFCADRCRVAAMRARNAAGARK